MTRTEANAVARDMERCGMNVTGLRNYGGGSWSVDATDTATGYSVTVHDADAWAERKRTAGFDDTPTAGRPPVYGERMTAHTIRMTAAQWAHVRQQGGDLSAGTRAIVQRDIEGEGR